MSIFHKLVEFAKRHLYLSPTPIRWDRWIWDNNNAEGMILESGLAVVLPGLVTARAFATEFDHDLYEEARLLFGYPTRPYDRHRFHNVRMLVSAGISMGAAARIYRGCWHHRVSAYPVEEQFNLDTICSTLTFIYARGKITPTDSWNLYAFFGGSIFTDPNLTVSSLFARIEQLPCTRS